MHRRGRVTRFHNHHLNDSIIDQEAVKLHRLLTDASSIAPPRGLAERTIARIEQLRNPKAEARGMPKPESPKE